MIEVICMLRVFLGTLGLQIISSPIFLVSVLVSVLSFLGFLLTRIMRRNARQIAEPEPEDDYTLEELLEDTGYLYDPIQDIFVSRMDAWQRKFGYCWLYDESAVPLGMVFDCEPVRFEYAGKRWLIEFWKGQYGITTGGEVGIYNNDGPDMNIPGMFDGTFYDSASDAERLPISYTLKKNGKVLFKRGDFHWWLTGFVLGEFTDPAELTMEISITLKDETMRDAFLNALRQIGYPEGSVSVDGNTASLVFAKPYSPQPRSRNEFSSGVVLKRNKFLCEQFNELTKDSGSMADKLKNVKLNSPELFSMIFMGKPMQMFKDFESIKDSLIKK
jgi:hypothetical protein